MDNLQTRMPMKNGSGNVRDLQQAATQSSSLQNLLSQFENFTDRLTDENDTSYYWNRNTPLMVMAGAGNDSITGGRGINVLFGQEGNDHLYGQSANDYLSGGEGDDCLESKKGVAA